MQAPGTVAAAAGAGVNRDPRAAVDAAVDALGRPDAGPGAGPDAGPPDLVVAFVGARHADAAHDVADRLRERLAPRTLVGVTADAVVAGGSEIEDPAAVSVWAADLPGATITPLRYPGPAAGTGPAGAGAPWPEPPEQTRAVVAFADPFSFPADGFLAWLGQARPGVPVAGGLASAARTPGGNRLLLDDRVYEHGAVAVALGGAVRVRTLVSQGCRPVGRALTVTRAERNLIEELAGAPPTDRIHEVYAQADARDQSLMRAGLHIGTVIDEYAEEFGRGDFLVRGVLGAHQDSGAVAVGDVVRVGQTVRFHVRDAASADEDLRELLEPFVAAGSPAAALLFTCNGRGSRLFETPNHDAALVTRAFGTDAVAGFFCAGEFGRVGGRNFLHGFTASLLVFDAPGGVEHERSGPQM